VEKAVPQLADGMAGDHKNALYDEIFSELKKYYTEEQIVALGGRPGYGSAMIVSFILSMCRAWVNPVQFHSSA